MYTSTDAPVRQRLLEGAVQCLREKGYAATTARDIAAASGANLRSIGYHFGSTKALLLTAISVNFRSWLEPLIDASTAGNGPAARRVEAGLERFVEALPDNAPMLRAWLEAVAVAGHEPELKLAIARNQQEFRDRLCQTLDAAGVGSPAESAAAIVSLCDGLIVRFLLHGEVETPRQAADLAARALRA